MDTPVKIRVALGIALLAAVTCWQPVSFVRAEQHWAFQPLSDASPPGVQDTAWPRSDIDRFVLAQLEKHGLRPVADANRHKWLRRVCLDLTGLPPTVEEIREFEADPSSKAHEKVVDRLLDSRAFGERWARHWLDLVGYADEIGTSNDVFAQYAWRYRDYVIDAYYNDTPFDRFIREQIAGDLLPHETVQQRATNLVATGFLVLGDLDIVEADKKKLLVNIIDHQVSKVGKAFLGMTLDCARCHDHKFDPVPLRDYYAMAGFFHSTSTIYKTNRGVWSNVNLIELPETELQKRQRAEREAAHTEKVAGMKQELKQAEERKAELDQQLENGDLELGERDKLTKERDEQADSNKKLDRKISHAEFFAPAVPKAHGVRDMDHPENMKITIRGNPRALGDEVPRGFLSVVSDRQPEIRDGQSGRRELAEWITSGDNPLTARVAVNRIWQKLFGVGLVRSVDYFGLPGESPSHPELLDHLALQFMREGWSQKRLIRSLVLSRTYGLDSAHDDLAHAADPENRLLWHGNCFRLDAEALRDTMIFISGKLVSSTGGPAMPLEFVENTGNIKEGNVNPPSYMFQKWRPGQEFLRTIYLPVIRSKAQPGPAMLRNVFDFPQPSQLTGQRAITAVPTQALFLMNSPVVKEQAAVLATRIQEEAGDDTRRLEVLWLTLLNRPITPPEQMETAAFLTAESDNGWTELCRALLASNEFLMRM